MASVLAIDVGNTNTVLGIWREDALVAHYRIETNDRRTADELSVLLRGLMAASGLEVAELGDAIVSTVVPTASSTRGPPSSGCAAAVWWSTSAPPPPGMW